MDDHRIMKNCYKVEVCGGNGCWWSIVVAETREEAKDKCHKCYGKYHEKLTIYIIENYDYFIE